MFWRLPAGLLATRLLSISSFSLQKKRDGHRPEEPRTTSRSTPRVSPPVQAKCRLSPCALRRPLSCPASPPPSLVSYPSRVSDFFSVFLPNRRASDRRSNGVAPRPDRALQRSIDRMADTNLSDSFHPQALARLCAARPSRPAEGRGEWGRPLLSSLAQHRIPGSRDPGPEHRADWNIPLPTSPLRRSSA